MDDIELILIGFTIGVCLVACDRTYPSLKPAGRSSVKSALLQLAVVGLAGPALWLLRLSITTNAVDFMEATLGILLGVNLDRLPGAPRLRRRWRSIRALFLVAMLPRRVHHAS